jgi:NAD+ synthase
MVKHALSDAIAAWLREELDEAGSQGFVLGLSGGVDSATAAALAVRAVGSDRVMGVLMPCESAPEDSRLARLVAQTFSIATVTVELTRCFRELMSALPPSDHRLARHNVKPRLRMSALYYLAAANRLLVLGSGNKTELAVGYFTKYGDGGVDLLPLGDLSKTQVWQLARDLGVPREVVERPPSAGLWPGQTDEGEMGITYSELDRILSAISAGDSSQIGEAKLQKVEMMMRQSEHKRAPIPVYRIPSEKTNE